MAENIHPFHRAAPCPICEKPSTFESRPFCSNRCADLDLGNWFNGTYTVPVIEADQSALPEGVPEQQTTPDGLPIRPRDEQD